MKPPNSPLRCAGGKSRQRRAITDLLLRDGAPVRFFEPFAYGLSVSLEMMGRLGPSVPVIAGDICPWVAAFWQRLATDHGQIAIASRHAIACFATLSPAIETDGVRLPQGMIPPEAVCNPTQLRSLYRACDPSPETAFILNRSSHPGVIQGDGGAKLTRFGESSIAAMEAAAQFLGQFPLFEFRHGDYAETIAAATPNDLIFFDPPYPNATNLYAGHQDWHWVNGQPGTAIARFAEVLTQTPARWIVAISDIPENRELLGSIPCVRLRSETWDYGARRSRSRSGSELFAANFDIDRMEVAA